MLECLFETFSTQKRLREERIGEELTRLLDDEPSLIVDNHLAARVGASRNTLYRAIYNQTRRERMYILADNKNRMILMSNNEFTRFMLRRIEDSTTQSTTRSATQNTTTDDLPDPIDTDAWIVNDNETSRADSEEVVFVDAIFNGAETNNFWEFPAADLNSKPLRSLVSQLAQVPDEVDDKGKTPDTASTNRPTRRLLTHSARSTEHDDPNGTELPPHRQTLPERSREPWNIASEVIANEK